MQKRGKDRARRLWLGNGAWLGLLLATACATFWLVNREPAAVGLKYGEFKQILRDKSVSFQKVKVGTTDIAGEILTRDTTSGPAGEASAPVAFHTQRRGLENDADLPGLLQERVGQYQGQDEDSPLKVVWSLLLSFLFVVPLVVGGSF